MRLDIDLVFSYFISIYTNQNLSTYENLLRAVFIGTKLVDNPNSSISFRRASHIDSAAFALPINKQRTKNKPSILEQPSLVVDQSKRPALQYTDTHDAWFSQKSNGLIGRPYLRVNIKHRGG